MLSPVGGPTVRIRLPSAVSLVRTRLRGDVRMQGGVARRDRPDFGELDSRLRRSPPDRASAVPYGRHRRGDCRAPWMRASRRTPTAMAWSRPLAPFGKAVHTDTDASAVGDDAGTMRAYFSTASVSRPSAGCECKPLECQEPPFGSRPCRRSTCGLLQ